MKKTIGFESYVPFGGYKQSLNNTYREQSEEGMRSHTLDEDGL
jgi:acyl-CoA reductase-like NAD-dependent aldehyde dehydrogenase